MSKAQFSCYRMLNRKTNLYLLHLTTIMGLFLIIQPNGMQLSQKSLNTSLALFELINQKRNRSQKTWKDGSKFQTLSWAKNFIHRTVWNGGGEEGSQHKQRFCLLQIWTGETLSVAQFKNQPASKQCWRVLQLPHWSMWMPIFMSFFSGLESRENLPTNLTLHWRNLLVILKSTATSPELLLFSAFLWIA